MLTESDAFFQKNSYNFVLYKSAAVGFLVFSLLIYWLSGPLLLLAATVLHSCVERASRPDSPPTVTKGSALQPQDLKCFVIFSPGFH